MSTVINYFAKFVMILLKGNEKEISEHKMIFIDDLKTKKEKQIRLFLNSINNTFKYILTSSNYILTHQKIKIIPSENINNISNDSESRIKYIKRIYDFPYITKFNNIDNQIDFLINIKNILKNQFNEDKIDIKSFSISQLNQRIINSIKNIFEDKYINSFKENIEILENNFYSDEDEYSDECFYIDENFDEKEYIKIMNNFYYVFCLIPKKKDLLNYKYKLKSFLPDYISKKLNIETKNIFISFNKKNNFIDSFIKTKKFSNYSIKTIIKNYPEMYELYQYKIIYDNILNNDKKDYFDYNGNTINPNSSYNAFRGTEKYDPPYGWFGIGLNVINDYKEKDWLENKTNGSKWAIAYHGVGQYLSSNQVKEALTNIILNNALIPGKSQNYKNYEDIRNPGNKIGEGVYLTPSINLAEKFSGLISIKGKRYKVVLMARVLIEKIREPKDIKFWILDQKYIRIYRILVKEIK